MPVIKADNTIIRKNSAGSDFRRRRVNFIEGANVTLTVTDDTTDNEVDVTIASSAGSSAAGSDTQVQFNDGGVALGGDAVFTYNKTSDTATLGALVTPDIHTVDSNTAQDINIVAGSALSGDNNGANLYLQAGNGTGTGSNGYIEFQGNQSDLYFDDNEYTFQHTSNLYGFTSSANRAFLDTSAIATSDKTFTLPNTTGVLALVANPTDITVPDEVYGAGWNGSLEVPTKNALYDKIETISGSGIAEELAIAYAVAL